MRVLSTSVESQLVVRAWVHSVPFVYTVQFCVCVCVAGVSRGPERELDLPRLQL